MRNLFKAAITALALAAASSVQAYNYGDLLVGFDGGSTDFVLDLGKFSGLTLGQTWNLGAAFGQNDLGSHFGVVGASSGLSSGHIYSTSPFIDQGGFGGGNNQAASANVVTLGTGISAGQGRTPTPVDSTGWFMQTDQTAGTPGNYFFNNYLNPNVSVGSAAYLFDNAPGGSATAANVFTYDSTSGILTYAPVPEPGSFSLLAFFGVLAFTFRRRFARG